MPGKNQGELKEIYGSCFYCCEETFNSQKIKELLFGNRINIIKKGSRLICKVNEKQTNEFEIKELKILLEELKKEILENSKEKGTLILPSIKKIEKLFGTTKLKTPSSHKADLVIITEKSTYFCSLKGKTSSKITILNPSILTCPKYEIVGFKEENLKELKEMKRTKLMTYLVSNYPLEFSGFYSEKNKDFNVVLKEIEPTLPKILADLILNKFRLTSSKIKELTTHKNEMIKLIKYLYNGTTSSKIVSIDPNIKLKEIIIDTDCSIIENNCDDKYFEEIFNKLVLDVGSASRYNFGKIFKEEDKYYIKWNLQLRI